MIFFFTAGCSSSKGGTGGSSGKTNAPKLDDLTSLDDESNRSLYVIDTTSTIKMGPDGAAPDSKVYEKPDAVREIIRTALKRNFIFQTMEPSALERLIDVFRPLTCKKGENIIEQGQTGDYM
jgi:hypothetical protein